MDFKKLLNVASYNSEEGKLKASVKRYDTEFSPATKLPKGNVQSSAIKAFLAKKQAEEQNKVVEATKKREELLSLRAQSTKNNKKAKIMASRTKDNDFSRIKLSEDEVEAKKKREAELLRMSLGNTVERMKARIAMEEKDKLLPKKRKRKSKNADQEEKRHIEKEIINTEVLSKSSETLVKKNKPRPLPPPTMSFSELMKIAANKQAKSFAMPKIPKKVTQEERPLTKKEKRLVLEEENRLKRKLMGQAGGGTNAKSNAPVTKLSDTPKSSLGSGTSKPMVVRVQKDQNVNPPLSKSANSNKPNPPSSKLPSLPQPQNNKVKTDQVKKVVPPKKPPVKNVDKSNKSSGDRGLEDIASASGVSIKAMLAEMEERIRKQVQDELKAQLAANTQSNSLRTSNEQKSKLAPVTSRQKIVNKSANSQQGPVPVKKPIPKALVEKQQKPVFHPNPYLQPPRRLLESRRPMKPAKRKIESDDDSDEDDMSDFIDDEPQHGFDEEDYSKHIKEIFGYDRNKYMNDDDDDIIETSFAEQMKEECRSAKLGLAEDLEDIRREKEELKRKNMKKK